MLSDKVQALIKQAQQARQNSQAPLVRASAEEVMKWYGLYLDNEQDRGVRRMLSVALMDFHEAVN